mmetsp:Transcript_22068/g.44252  ORF Transcript_22068/g.44252 Transcript_22068/m.44252 type:complete len:104 (+) Transcript_22068:1430-1741(+)
MYPTMASRSVVIPYAPKAPRRSLNTLKRNRKTTTDILNDPVSSAKITAGWSKSSAIGIIHIWTPDPSSNRSRDILSCHTLLELQKAQPMEPAKTAESERRTIR